MNLFVNPIFLSADRETEEGELYRSQSIDSKVRGLVLGRIGISYVPPIALEIPIGREQVRKRERGASWEKRGPRTLPAERRAPIGLLPVEPQGWLNALMQLILFVPRFSELFYFAPKNFSLFRDYIDRYRDDQEALREVSLANGELLFRFFSLRLGKAALKESVQFLRLALDFQCDFFDGIEELNEGKGEFFLSDQRDVKLFVRGDFGCYELDAFIEERGEGRGLFYIAYCKLGGTWYQCDDEQILLVRSNVLQKPLSRALLLHYKKVRVG